MKKDHLILALLGLAALVVYFRSFGNFFVQDDFILITEYTKSNLLSSLVSIFNYPAVSHYRPIHDLYFVLSGFLFGRNYFGYHFVSLLVLILSSFLIFKVSKEISQDEKVGLTAGLLYAISPIHFLSIYWISGNAVLLGFMFFVFSLYCLIKKRYLFSAVLFGISFLASESFVIGVAVILGYLLLFKQRVPKSYLLAVIFSAVIFAIVRFLFLTPKAAFVAYSFEFSSSVFLTLKYYLLRIAGISEAANDLGQTLLAVLFMVITLVISSLDFKNKPALRIYFLAIIIVISGFFPFVFIPNHLGANYMSLSLFGVVLAFAFALRRVPNVLLFLVLSILITVQVFNVRALAQSSWVTQRAKLSNYYLRDLEQKNLPAGSKIVFTDNTVSSSKEAYVVLGQGKAIGFWFPYKNYEPCFSFYQQCE